MSLASWEKNGWLRPHRASAREIADLLAVVDRDVTDSAKDLSSDWRFNIAYNAILQASIAALAAAGYEPEKGRQHHFRALQSLGETVGLSKAQLQLLEAYRKKRNIAEYERIGLVSDADAAAVRKLAEEVRQRTVRWLREKHPDLLSDD